MKTKYIILSIFTVMALVATSCEDFLEEDAKGTLTPASFFKNVDEVNLALNGLERNFLGVDRQEHLGTDVGTPGRVPIAGAWGPNVYDITTDNGTVAAEWSRPYTAIRNANLVLASLENATLPDDVKGDAIAQALFYRAHQYLLLVYTFGDVPYWRDEVVLEEVAPLGKTDSDVIISGMIDDLDQAISSGYLSTARWNDNEGRPTVWAVRMLKAYCHIWLEEWDEARTELIEITANSPHGPLGPYAEKYRLGNELHHEIIFGRQFMANVLPTNSHAGAHFNSNSENPETRTLMGELNVFSTSAAITLRQSFADSYDDNDIRKLYNVWERETLADGSVAEFNWIYVPKLMRARIPVSDPLADPPETFGQSSQPARIFVLADAYLLLAEAEFMINGSTPAALAAINTVRSMDRTGLSPYTSITIEDIRNERAWELTGEGYWGRKYDLVRWGILESTVLAMPAAETAAGAYSVAITYAQQEADRIAAGQPGQFLVFPVPLAEIQKSQDVGGSLVQNPLWE